MYLYQKDAVKEILDSEPELQSILAGENIQDFECPYDKLLIKSYEFPRDVFLNLVLPARYYRENTEGTYYLNKLSYTYFSVQWRQMNRNAPQTSIMINPWKHRLTPAQVLQIVKFILGDYNSAIVSGYDDKVDLHDYMNAKEVAERLYVGYQKNKPTNYKDLDETYNFGRRNGQQGRDYDKGQEQGMEDVVWTRIEKQVRIKDKSKRSTLTNFLYSKREDPLKHMVIVDLDKISGRDKIKRRVKKYGTFMEAYQDLNHAERKKLKGHEAFENPAIDIKAIFQSDLKKWLSLSPMIYFRYKINDVLDIWTRTKTKYTSSNWQEKILKVKGYAGTDFNLSLYNEPRQRFELKFSPPDVELY